MRLLAEHGYQPDFGARPLRRTIRRELDNPLSSMLLDGRIGEGRTVRVDASDDGLTIASADAADSAEPAAV